MENKVRVWIARDKSGELFLSSERPNKKENYWGSEAYMAVFRLNSSSFSSIKWEDDEPTEAYITLAEPQEQPKQEQPKQEKEIDWEQRRYEIAKEMMPVLYRHGMEAQKHGQSVKRKDTVYYAVIFADMLIEELMKGE